MGLFNEMKRIINEEENPSAMADILVDINTLADNIELYKILFINPEMYKKLDKEIKRIRQALLDNESKKIYSVKTDIINSSVNMRYELENYMTKAGNEALTKLFIKETDDNCNNLLISVKSNPTKVIELINSLDNLQKSFAKYDFLVNNNYLNEKINKTKYELIKEGYYLNRIVNSQLFNVDTIMMFSQYIIFDAYNFIQSSNLTPPLLKIKEELELAILFGSFSDPNNLIKIMELLRIVSKEAFKNGSQKLDENKTEVITNPNSKDQIQELFDKLTNITKQIQELELYDIEHYKKYLDELTKLKIDFYNDQQNPKYMEIINSLIMEINAHFNGVAEDKEQMKIINITVSRIKSAKNIAELDKIADEIKLDSVLNTMPVITETIAETRLNILEKNYQEIKNNGDTTNILLYKNNIIENAREIITKCNQNPFANKKLVEEINKLIKLEPSFDVLRQLLVIINSYEKNNLNYYEYSQIFMGYSDEIIKMIVRNTEYSFEKVNIDSFYTTIKIDKEDKSDRMNCATHNILINQTDNHYQSLFNQSIINSYSAYRLSQMFGSHQDNVICLINESANSVINDGLIPVFMINRASQNNVNINQTREYIRSKLLDLKSDQVIYSALMNDDTFEKIRYIVDEYSLNNSETKAENMLLDLIPGLANVDVTYLSLKVFFSYYHDYKFYDDLFNTYMFVNKKNNQYKI